MTRPALVKTICNLKPRASVGSQDVIEALLFGEKNTSKTPFASWPASQIQAGIESAVNY